RYDQQHGWGYRFIYGSLGNLVLLAVAGVETVPLDRRGAIRLLGTISLGLSLLVQVPLRGAQASTFLGRFSRTIAYQRTIRSEVVGVGRRTFWCAQDCMRTEPFLTNRPRFVLLDWMADERRRELMSRPESQFHLLTWQEAERSGIPARR